MKYVPSLPPPITGVPDRVEVQALTAVGAVKPVQPRSLPPLVTRLRPVQPAPTEALRDLEKGGVERRAVEPPQQGRRVYCRRFIRHPLLVELRSTISRRRKKQRESDKIENLDEFV